MIGAIVGDYVGSAYEFAPTKKLLLKAGNACQQHN